MGDAVPPIVQCLQVPVAGSVPLMLRIERGPKLDPQALEVCSDVAGTRVPLVKHQAVVQVHRDEVPDLLGNRHQDGIHAQGVKSRAKPWNCPANRTA